MLAKISYFYRPTIIRSCFEFQIIVIISISSIQFGISSRESLQFFSLEQDITWMQSKRGSILVSTGYPNTKYLSIETTRGIMKMHLVHYRGKIWLVKLISLKTSSSKRKIKVQDRHQSSDFLQKCFHRQQKLWIFCIFFITFRILLLLFYSLSRRRSMPSNCV